MKRTIIILLICLSGLTTKAQEIVNVQSSFPVTDSIGLSGYITKTLQNPDNGWSYALVEFTNLKEVWGVYAIDRLEADAVKIVIEGVLLPLKHGSNIFPLYSSWEYVTKSDINNFYRLKQR